VAKAFLKLARLPTVEFRLDIVPGLLRYYRSHFILPGIPNELFESTEQHVNGHLGRQLQIGRILKEMIVELVNGEFLGLGSQTQDFSDYISFAGVERQNVTRERVLQTFQGQGCRVCRVGGLDPSLIRFAPRRWVAQVWNVRQREARVMSFAVRVVSGYGPAEEASKHFDWRARFQSVFRPVNHV
jgi:hypothetical protein